ncbi:glycoside hydrolase [Hymenopellis radicata]|nr:glycoside hydrolase [Hymenopellis radicata]
MNVLLVALAATTLASASPIALQSNNPAASASLVSHTRRDAPKTNSVNIQLFGWDWDSVAAECTNFIGPAGYGYITVLCSESSHGTYYGGEWWADYQVVSYKLNSARGTREQFKTMVDTCHAAGVLVLTDTIFNHMANLDSRIGVDGSTFTHYNYEGYYQYQDFHHCGLTSNDNINHWEKIPEVQICELSGLADLNTSSTYVQGMVAGHADDLLSLGVDGFRLDAAKQMSVSDLQAIIDTIGDVKPSYMFLEVPVPENGVSDVKPGDYTGIGDVNEFRYALALRKAFRNGDITSLKDLTTKGWLESLSAAVFVTNHDTERSSGVNSMNANAPNNAYELGHIFMLGHDYGVLPTILSSYEGFDEDSDAGPRIMVCAGDCTQEVGWLCQHRWTSVVGMTGFRNAVSASEVNTLCDWVEEGTTRIAFGRGSTGFVAINNDEEAWEAVFTTSLADGVYCNVIDGALSNGVCTNSSITISEGSFSVAISAYWAVAIHTDAMLTSTSTSASVSDSPTLIVSATTSDSASATSTSVSTPGLVAAVSSWATSWAWTSSWASTSTWAETSTWGTTWATTYTDAYTYTTEVEGAAWTSTYTAISGGRLALFLARQTARAVTTAM